MTETFTMEGGKFVIDETNYNRVFYRNTLSLPQEYVELLKEIQQCDKKIQENKQKIKNYVMEEFTPKGLPAAFKCVSVDIKS